MHEVFPETSCIFASCGCDGFIVILFLPNPTGSVRAEKEAVPLPINSQNDILSNCHCRSVFYFKKEVTLWMNCIFSWKRKRA